MSRILSARGVVHTWSGHPSMPGLFFMESAPRNYRDWATSNYEFYDELSVRLIQSGILVEPDSREPFFVSSAHDDSCLNETMEKFESCLSFVLDDQARKS